MIQPAENGKLVKEKVNEIIDGTNDNTSNLGSLQGEIVDLDNTLTALRNDLTKSAIYMIYGTDVNAHGDFVFNGTNNNYHQIFNRRTQSQKGIGLTRSNTTLTVNRTGHYLVNLQVQVMSNTVNNSLISGSIYRNGNIQNPNNPKGYITNDNGTMKTINVMGLLACDAGDTIQFALNSSVNQTVRVAAYTSMTVIEL